MRAMAGAKHSFHSCMHTPLHLRECLCVGRFILVSSQGYEKLAAYGEDHGGSHYNYHVLEDNNQELKLLKGSNRKDVIAWWVGMKNKRKDYAQRDTIGGAY